MSRMPAALLLTIVLALPSAVAAEAGSLPKRLIIALDGISYRDMKALQNGVTCTGPDGKSHQRRAFYRGYFPVSRLVSTFPSASDVAWSTVFGNRPLIAYHRTHYSKAANATLFVNGVSSSIAFERQMTWRMVDGWGRATSYVRPRQTYDWEVAELCAEFLKAENGQDYYYAYIYATDPAQHRSSEIMAMLCRLDEALERVRSAYREKEGRELEILILSDHGNNHAGPPKRVGILSFLKKAGYHVAKSINTPKDVVLPTVGMESWVEVHNAPSETQRLAETLWHLEGVDIVTAKVAERENRFLVLNSVGERAWIYWDEADDRYKYSTETGDPLGYEPVVKVLAAQHELDAEGFGAADAWMKASLDHRYPVALERIAHGHTRVTLNPASILISLDNHYAHASWLVNAGSRLVSIAGTHGGLDDINSTGILLSNFAPTRDTTADRVAGAYGGFPGRRIYRAEEDGAEWICGRVQSMAGDQHEPLAHELETLPGDRSWLRIWSPKLAGMPKKTPINVTVKRDNRHAGVPVRRGDFDAVTHSKRLFTLSEPAVFREEYAYERVYALPEGLDLEPRKLYRISGELCEPGKSRKSALFSFRFYTDARGIPVVY